VSLRESGSGIRKAIQSLATTPIPQSGVTQFDPNIYLWEIEAHLVTYEVLEEQHRIIVSSVQPRKTPLKQ
jgi:hypothetical protein